MSKVFKDHLIGIEDIVKEADFVIQSGDQANSHQARRNYLVASALRDVLSYVADLEEQISANKAAYEKHLKTVTPKPAAKAKATQETKTAEENKA